VIKHVIKMKKARRPGLHPDPAGQHCGLQHQAWVGAINVFTPPVTG
jgi:hypothetical protein